MPHPTYADYLAGTDPSVRPRLEAVRALVQDCVSSADFTSDGELDALFVGLNLVVSERPPNSRQILLNSLDGIVQTELNSVSGMPRLSESRFMRERLNSEIFSPPKSSTSYVWTRT